MGVGGAGGGEDALGVGEHGAFGFERGILAGAGRDGGDFTGLKAPEIHLLQAFALAGVEIGEPIAGGAPTLEGGGRGGGLGFEGGKAVEEAKLGLGRERNQGLVLGMYLAEAAGELAQQ